MDLTIWKRLYMSIDKMEIFVMEMWAVQGTVYLMGSTHTQWSRICDCIVGDYPFTSQALASSRVYLWFGAYHVYE